LSTIVAGKRPETTSSKPGAVRFAILAETAAIAIPCLSGCIIVTFAGCFASIFK